MVNECIPFDNAYPYLSAEFGRRLGLATYNGADMGLEDTFNVTFLTDAYFLAKKGLASPYKKLTQDLHFCNLG